VDRWTGGWVDWRTRTAKRNNNYVREHKHHTADDLRLHSVRPRVHARARRFQCVVSSFIYDRYSDIVVGREKKNHFVLWRRDSENCILEIRKTRYTYNLVAVCTYNVGTYSRCRRPSFYRAGARSRICVI